MARAKLDALKLWWVVYGVFVAIVELASDGIDSDSLTAAVMRVGLTFALAWYFTKQLAEKSSLVWAFGVVFGLIGTIASGIIAVNTLVGDGGFELGEFLLAVASAVIHFRTYRVLRDTEVKRHVMID